MSMHMTLQRRVHAPPAAVWELLADLQARPTWVPWCEAVEVTHGDPYALAAGSAWTEHRTAFGRDVVESVRVVEAAPPHTCVWVLDGTEGALGRGRFTSHWTLRDVRGTTVVKLALEAEDLGVFGSVLGRLSTIFVRRVLLAEMDALAAQVLVVTPLAPGSHGSIILDP